MRTMLGFSGSSQRVVRRLPIECSILRYEGVRVKSISGVSFLGWWRRSSSQGFVMTAEEVVQCHAGGP